MSYIRRVRRGIPKNTNSCYGCKNRILKPLYSYEQDTNSYYKDGEYIICKYLNIISSNVDVFEFILKSNLSNYTEEDIDKIIKDMDTANDLHHGHKVCGLYKEKIKNKGHFTKFDKDNSCIDEDDIPF